MEKKHLYVLVIAAIFGLMLILPVSAAISFQKYTPTGNTIFKPVATLIQSVPLKNVPVTVQPQLISWPQTPVDLQIFKTSKFNSSASLFRPVPMVTPVPDNNEEKPPDSWWITVTVWNRDHTYPVPDVFVKFEKFSTYITCSNCPIGTKIGYTIAITPIATGKTDSNGKISILVHDNSGDQIWITAIGPVVTENGEQVTYSGFQSVNYIEPHILDITLDSRNLYYPG
jgi:hypothetical protein